MPELPDAKKWFGGFFDVTRYIKDIGTILRVVLILFVAYLIVVGCVALWRRAMPQQPILPTVETVNTETCDIAHKKAWKFGLINLW